MNSKFTARIAKMGAQGGKDRRTVLAEGRGNGFYEKFYRLIKSFV